MVADPRRAVTQRWALRLALLGVASALGLGLAEAASRVLLDPVDFLQPVLVRDDTLRWRVAPGSGGHDAWGFRNPGRPERAAIVAVGDSQTYGFGERARDAWPRWLERLTGREVYSLALGGYGPLDYEALVAGAALELSPEVVVVGLYLGNDLLDAHRLAHARPHWADRRRLSAPEPIEVRAGAGDPEAPGPRPLRYRVRRWLGERSVLFRLAGASIGGALRGAGIRLGIVSTTGVSALHDADGRLRTLVDPIARYRGLNGRDARVEEGLAITLDAIDRMAAACGRAGVRLVVLGIPTKVRVYEPLLAADPAVRHGAVIAELVRHEAGFAERLEARVRGAGARWVDGLAALRAGARAAAAGQAPEPYPWTTSGHPNGEGYRRLAAAVALALAAPAQQQEAGGSAGAASGSGTPLPNASASASTL